MEKWILRFLVTGVLALGIWAAIGSTQDIKRYLQIRQM